MLIEMPELGGIKNKCVASLAGLAPIARDSGQTRGRRVIRGGRAHLRQALYMPALVAVRFNAAFKNKYQGLIAARIDTLWIHLSSERHPVITLISRGGWSSCSRMK